jgi:hypothetical protein
METSEQSLYYTLATALTEEERNRPINEQFPFLRSDMDLLVENTLALEASSKRLIETEKNKGKEMEDAVIPLFIDWLENNSYDPAVVPILDGKISSLEEPSKLLVQWDGIIYAVKNEDKKLFLIETKQIAHENDISTAEKMVSTKEG